MKFPLAASIFAFLGLNPLFIKAADTATADKSVYVILKLDDLTWPSPAWKRTLEHLQAKGVKSSVGVICNSLEKDRQPYYTWIKEIKATGLVEFWCHGLDHKQWKEGDTDFMEFKGPSYEQQKAHLVRCQQLALEKLGEPWRTFGAPFNAIDDNTLKALSEDPELKVFLYGKPADAAKTPNLLILDRSQMNIENPLFKPNAERLERDFKALAGKRDLFTIQGHPNNWDEPRFAEFVKLIDFLIQKNVIFTTPTSIF